jgi:hypothetical protein
LGPEAQPYVREVFKAHGDWQKELTPIGELMDPSALWGKEDDAWRDSQAVSERLARVRRWRNQSEHQHCLEQLIGAIQQVPPSFAADASRITSAAEKELIVSDPDRVVQAATQYETLLALVEEKRSGFAEDKQGLAFANRETTAAVLEAWDRLHQTLNEAKDEERARAVAEMEWMLDEGKRLRDEALQRKREIRRELSDPREALRRARRLDIDIHYYDEMIRQAEQQQLERSRAAAAETSDE